MQSQDPYSSRFQRATGMAPLEYVHVLRIEKAKQVLESAISRSRLSPVRLGTRIAGYSVAR